MDNNGNVEKCRKEEKEMKCKRCGQEMRRQKVDNRKYRFVCPVCGLTISPKEDKQEETEYEKAYNIVMGRDAESR